MSELVQLPPNPPGSLRMGLFTNFDLTFTPDTTYQLSLVCVIGRYGVATHMPNSAQKVVPNNSQSDKLTPENKCSLA